MKKITSLLILFIAFYSVRGFAQLANGGTYFWNLTSITYSVNDKTELVLQNKDHYSNEINHLDYFHFDLTGFRQISEKFSLGLGIRQTESYKPERWNPGQSYLLYGVYEFTPGNIKIKFANRFQAKTYKTSDSQYEVDNITNVDFFVRSTGKFPRPYLMDELFFNLKLANVQTLRLYGGFRLINNEHFGIDIFYCYWKTRLESDWKNYNVFAISTKFHI
jgi:hypothetical protein